MSNTLKYSVSSSSESPAKTKINARGFDLLVDEFIELGGKNEAPNPAEYILAGYAGCLNITIEGDLNPGRLLGRSFRKRAGYQQLNVTLKTSTKLDKGTEVKWLKEIEYRCPVNDNLTNKTPINFH